MLLIPPAWFNLTVSAPILSRDDKRMATEGLQISSKSESKSILELTDQYFKESSATRKKFESSWQKYEQYYDGRHWKNDNDKNPTKNWVKMIIEAEVPILTDGQTGISIIARSDERNDDAKMLEEAIRYVFEDQALILKEPEICRDKLKVGTGHYYVDYDPDENFGRGRITIGLLNWRNFRIDPLATEIDKAKYTIIDSVKRLDEIKRIYPNVADELKPESIQMYKDDQGETDGYRPDVWHPGKMSDDGYDVQIKDVAIVREFWIKDYSTEKIPVEETLLEIGKEAEEFLKFVNPDISKNEDHTAHIDAHREFKMISAAEALSVALEMITEQDIETIKQDPQIGVMFQIIDDHIRMHESYEKVNQSGLRPVYQNNLRLVIRVGRTICYDGPPDVGDGMAPVAPDYCYKQSDCYYADGEVKDILSPQKIYNEIDLLEYEGLRLNSNSGWVYDDNSGVNGKTLTNEPGIVIKKKQGTEVRRLEPGQVRSELQMRKQNELDAIQQISGMHEATQGIKPDGVTSGYAINTITSQAIGRIRLKKRYQDHFTKKRLAELVASRVIRYWQTDKILKLYDANGMIKTVNFSPERLKDLDYEVRISTGPMVGENKEQQDEKMKELALAGVISPKTFVESVDLPNKGKILEEMNAQEQMNALAMSGQ